MPAKKTTKRAPARRRRSPARAGKIDQRALLAGLYLAPGVAQRVKTWPVIGQVIKQHGALGLGGILLMLSYLQPRHKGLLQGAGIGALVSATQPAITSAIAEMGGAVPQEMLAAAEDLPADASLAALDPGPEPALDEVGKYLPEEEGA